MTSWDQALNFVDDKVQDLKHLGFHYLAKRPYRSELPESNADVVFVLLADPLSESVIRAVVVAESQRRPQRRFAHGFDQHRDGRTEELSIEILREFQ